MPRAVFRPAELAVMAALALAVCGWPGSNFMRFFTTGLAMPNHILKTQASWQAADVMSYLPPGKGVLLADGKPHPVAVDLLIQGSSHPLGFADLPWGAWWPTLRLWLGFALCMSVGALFMALIVHPQWSRRELLAYPIARFFGEATEAGEGSRWPRIAQSRLFWLGFGALLVLHLINGLSAWFPAVISVPLRFDFSPLRQVFPRAAQVPGANNVFLFTLFPTVVAFTYFLSLEVSFSLGMVGFVSLGLGAVLIGQGIAFTGAGYAPGAFSLMGFGGYLATTAMLLYVGRRHYRNALASAFGGRRLDETPAYTPWAVRGLLLCAALGVVLLHGAGLDWFFGILAVGLVFMLFLVVSRIYAETGALMVQAVCNPASMVLALFGPVAVGPTAYLIVALMSVLVATDARETWMAYFVHGLRLTDTPAGAPPRRIAPLLLVMLVAGLVVALAVTFRIQYNHGVNQSDRWGVEWLPAMPFNTATAMISDLQAHGELAAACAQKGLARLAAWRPEPGAWLWVTTGAALVFGCSVARLRLPWWPLHPVLFLVWGTWAGNRITISCFLGWLIKLAVVRLGGDRAYRKVRPLMIGIIAGEIIAALLWAVVGAIYYGCTGITPKSPSIFP
jgi:hypothetical protein